MTHFTQTLFDSLFSQKSEGKNKKRIFDLKVSPSTMEYIPWNPESYAADIPKSKALPAGVAKTLRSLRSMSQ